MRKILFIALLLVCITAKKHHKQEDEGQAQQGDEGQGQQGGEGQAPKDPMAECFEQNCQDQALACFFDDKCMNTFETCNQTFGDAITPEDLEACTAEDKVAQSVIQCIADNCSAVQTLMSYFSRRQH